MDSKSMIWNICIWEASGISDALETLNKGFFLEIFLYALVQFIYPPLQAGPKHRQGGIM